jgi:hypothetical protein
MPQRSDWLRQKWSYPLDFTVDVIDVAGQAARRRHGSGLGSDDRRARREFEDVRHGIVDLLAGFRVNDHQVCGMVRLKT